MSGGGAGAGEKGDAESIPPGSNPPDTFVSLIDRSMTIREAVRHHFAQCQCRAEQSRCRARDSDTFQDAKDKHDMNKEVKEVPESTSEGARSGTHGCGTDHKSSKSLVPGLGTEPNSSQSHMTARHHNCWSRNPAAPGSLTAEREFPQEGPAPVDPPFETHGGPSCDKDGFQMVMSKRDKKKKVLETRSYSASQGSRYCTNRGGSRSYVLPNPTDPLSANGDNRSVEHLMGSKVPLKRGSLASEPTACQTTDASTSDPTYCMATFLGHGSDETLLASLVPKMISFLNRFKKKGEKCVYYTSKVSWLKQRDKPELKVNFEHLLEDKANWELAVTVCNFQKVHHSHMKEVARKFFNSNGYNVASAEIKFKKLPKRLMNAKEFLLSSDRAKLVSLFGKVMVTVGTTHGRRCFDLILSRVLVHLKNGLSWCGGLKPEDMIVLEYADGHLELKITKAPVKERDAVPTDRALDLVALWDGLEEFYLLHGVLPLYYAELKVNLNDAALNTLKHRWIYTYFFYHPAFFSSLSRGNFIGWIHKDFTSLKLGFFERYQSVFHRSPALTPDW